MMIAPNEQKTRLHGSLTLFFLLPLTYLLYFTYIQGGSGYAKNIIFDQIKLDAVSNPIIIDQFYNPGGAQPNEVISRGNFEHLAVTLQAKELTI